MPADSDSPDRRARRWLEPGQVGALREACYRDGRPAARARRDDAAVTLLYDAALRAAELAALDASNLRDRSLFLPAEAQVADGTGRSPGARRLPLDDDTLRTLNAHLDARATDADALFCGADGRVTVPEVRDLVRSAAEAAGVAPHRADGSRGDPAEVTPATLRHSAAWRLLYAGRGASLYDVQSRLRHASLDATKRLCEGFREP
ncbi:MAG: tyrosine-type recombinase/integrase [Haloferacaceae archaeon]